MDEWNGSYVRRLFPFLGASVALHVLTILIVIGIGMLSGGGGGLDVRLFDPGKYTGTAPSGPLLGGFSPPERIKVFRIDFFRQIIPWRPPEPEPVIEEVQPPEEPPAAVTEPEEEPPPEEPEAEVSTSQPEPAVEESAGNLEPTLTGDQGSAGQGDLTALTGNPRDLLGSLTDIGVPIENDTGPVGPPTPILAQPDLSQVSGDEGALPDAMGVFQGSETENPEAEANVFPMPAWQVADANDVQWDSTQFLGEYTIYIIADFSKRHGPEQLLAWNYTFRELLGFANYIYPPNIVNVATTLEDPYTYDRVQVGDMLKQAYADEHIIGVMAVDTDGALPKSLGYTELPQPIVVFVDQYGFIRLILIGRVNDIQMDNIKQAMGVIADMWQWTDQERTTLPTATMLLIQNFIRPRADDPEQRKIVPQGMPENLGYPSAPQPAETSTDQPG